MLLDDTLINAGNEGYMSQNIALVNYRSKIKECKSEGQVRFITAKLWIQLIECINVIKLFIRVERMRNCETHLFTVSIMLPLFGASGYIPLCKKCKITSPVNARITSKIKLALCSIYASLSSCQPFCDTGYQ